MDSPLRLDFDAILARSAQLPFSFSQQPKLVRFTMPRSCAAIAVLSVQFGSRGTTALARKLPLKPATRRGLAIIEQAEQRMNQSRGHQNSERGDDERAVPKGAMEMDTAAGQENWQEDVFRVLKQHDVRHVLYVPDNGHSTAIRLSEADTEINSVVLTTEEEGIGYLAGSWLGGERGVLLMQSSGVGNCINALALHSCAHFPLLMVITRRGDWAESNPWQNPMGQAAEKALNLMNVLTWQADDPRDVAPLLHGAATMAFNGDRACALLLGQRLMGEKEWVK